MNIEKMREEFEAAYMRDMAGNSTEPASVWLERVSDGEYRSYQARGAWWAWQASRAAIEVELPEIVCFEGAYDSIKTHEFVPRMIDIDDADEIFGLCRRIEAREAIESMGLKVKTS